MSYLTLFSHNSAYDLKGRPRSMIAISCKRAYALPIND